MGVFLSLILMFSVVPAQDIQAKTSSETKTKTQKMTLILTPGMTQNLYSNVPGKVKWKNSNNKVATFSKKNDSTYMIKAKKTGSTVVKFSAKNYSLQITVKVKSKSTFEQAWIKNWIRDNIPKNATAQEKLLIASFFITSNYSYGSTATATDVIVKGKGTCVSGGKLLVDMLKAMGFKNAQLRFAAKDKMNRYPSGVVFASQHHNVKVKIKGKTYYVDGTPGSCFAYLSTDKKPLYYGMVLNGQILTLYNKL